MATNRPLSRPYSLTQFAKDDFSLAVFTGDRLIFHSRERNLRPLAKFIKNFGWKHEHLILYDKYVGRAAALLFVGLKPQGLYTPIVSRAAIPILNMAHIHFTAKKRVHHLMDIASRGMCTWEKASYGHTPASFWRLVKKRIIR